MPRPSKEIRDAQREARKEYASSMLDLIAAIATCAERDHFKKVALIARLVRGVNVHQGIEFDLAAFRKEYAGSESISRTLAAHHDTIVRRANALNATGAY